MQVNNNVSFGSIQRTIVPVSEFAKAGSNVGLDVILPYAQKTAEEVRIFVGGPKFVHFLKNAAVNGYGDVDNYLAKMRRTMPAFLSKNEPQPTYIFTGKEDIAKLDDFMALRAGEDGNVRKRFGLFGEFMENMFAFEKRFANKIEDVDYADIKKSLDIKG